MGFCPGEGGDLVASPNGYHMGIERLVCLFQLNRAMIMNGCEVIVMKEYYVM